MIRWSLAAILSICAIWISTSSVQSFRTGKPVHIYRSPLTTSSVMAVADRWQLRLWHWSYQAGGQKATQSQGAFGGFLYDFSSRQTGNGMTLLTHKVALPSVIAFIPAVGFPALLVVRRPLRRWQRKSRGQCLKCGYSLAGVPEPRCPECGTNTGRVSPKFPQQGDNL